MNNTNNNNTDVMNNTATINLRIASLNCNDLAKVAKPHIRRDMIRFLRDQSHDLISLQETPTSNTSIIASLEQQFITTSAVWTTQCGIVSLISDIEISPLEVPYLDGRLILAQITHTQQ